MVDIIRKSLTCREVWFDENWSASGADLVLFYHWSSKWGHIRLVPFIAWRLILMFQIPTFGVGSQQVRVIRLIGP